jgi:hypothetical protein
LEKNYPTQLTEQLDPEATLRAACRVVPMLNPASDNLAHLAQLPLQPRFPLLPLRAQTEARAKLFPKIQTDLKSKSDFEKKSERSYFEF